MRLETKSLQLCQWLRTHVRELEIVSRLDQPLPDVGDGAEASGIDAGDAGHVDHDIGLGLREGLEVAAFASDAGSVEVAQGDVEIRHGWPPARVVIASAMNAIVIGNVV